MAIVFTDGFDDWAYADRTQEGWTTTTGSGASAPTIVTGRRAGSSALQIPLAINTNGQNSVTRTLAASYSTLFTHAAINITTPATNTRAILQLREGTTPHISICLKTDGNLEARRGEAAGTLLGTTTSPLTGSTWYSMEVKVVVHDSTGTVDIKINGTSVLALTGQDTRNGGSGVINNLLLGDPVAAASSGVVTLKVDDLVLYDTTGSVCNAFTGDVRVDSVLPSGAGDLTDWTPSSGSNYACVDEATANTSDYVSSSTAAQIDLYAMGDISHTPASIFGVWATALATKDDAGARSIKMKSKSGGTTGTGSSLALTNGSWVRMADLIEVDPNTSAAWTKTNLNAAQFGVECV